MRVPTRSITPSHYRVLGRVGRGQFGQVYFGIHRATGERVALKELDSTRLATHQFLRELRFLLALEHPNIVACWACEYIGSRRYLVMDYCEGGTLRQLLDRSLPLPTSIALSLIEQTLAGLAHAHAQDIVHCDLKPENILLTVQASGWVPRLSDFGIARFTQESQKSAEPSGSPAYMAPEQFYGQYSKRADVYSVGVLLYEVLVGDRPFSGTPGALMAAHLNTPLHLPEHIPMALRPILTRALSKFPGARYRDAQVMHQALQAAIEQLPTESATPVPQPSLGTALSPVKCESIEQRRETFGPPMSHTHGHIACDFKTSQVSIEPHPRGRTWKYDVPDLKSALWLDSRHLGVLSKHKSGSRLTVLTRRGSCCGQFNWPIELNFVQVKPHLVAIEAHNPQMLVLIKLNPFEVKRIQLPIEPTAVLALEQGYALGDAAGKLLILDEQGEILATALVTRSITALEMCGAYLQVGTWSESGSSQQFASKATGQILTFDLRSLWERR